MTFTPHEIAALAAVVLGVGVAVSVMLAWALRPDPEDDMEEAYMRDLLSRGAPRWRIGHGAYDHEQER